LQSIVCYTVIANCSVSATCVYINSTCELTISTDMIAVNPVTKLLT